jgi:hypothetical protein
MGGSVGRSGRNCRRGLAATPAWSFCTRRLATRLMGMFAAISVKLAESGTNAATTVVPMEGVEPTHSYEYQILSLARNWTVKGSWSDVQVENI